MKRRWTLILVVAFAVVLIASLACATEKVKQAKPTDHKPVTITEEEALQAELLDAVENSRTISPDTGDGKKKVAEVAKVRLIDKRPEK